MVRAGDVGRSYFSAWSRRLCLVDQHHWDAVADRVAASAGRTDQAVSLLVDRRLTEWAGQDLEQLRIDQDCSSDAWSCSCLRGIQGVSTFLYHDTSCKPGLDPHRP